MPSLTLSQLATETKQIQKGLNFVFWLGKTLFAMYIKYNF